MSEPNPSWNTILRNESLLFLALLFTGLFLLPAAIYLVGKAVFGEYGGTGFAAFYGTLHSELRGGEPSVWFLVLSPYMIWQLLRFSFRAFRTIGGHQGSAR